MTDVLMRQENTQMSHVKMEEEVAAMHLWTKDCQCHKKLGERHGTHVVSAPLERTNSADTFLSDF